MREREADNTQKGKVAIEEKDGGVRTGCRSAGLLESGILNGNAGESQENNDEVE